MKLSKRKFKKKVEAIVHKVHKKVKRQLFADAAGVASAELAKLAVAPDLPQHRELVTLRLNLLIQSECGDVVQHQPGVVQHNNLTDAELLEAFERQVSAAREQVHSYLRRREERKRPLATSQENPFPNPGLGGQADPGDEDTHASTVWGDVPFAATDAADLDSGD